MARVYIMLSGTGTLFSRALKKKLKDDCPHVSIILDEDFNKGYSFGRKKLRNPLIGGFNEEKYTEWVKVFKNIKCEIYELEVSAEKYVKLLEKLDEFISNKEIYKYHLVGVLGRGLGYNIEIENHYFCSQFVAEVLRDTDILDLGEEPICCVSSMFRECKKLKLIYSGGMKELLMQDEICNVTTCIE